MFDWKNEVNFEGNLTRDPEFTFTKNGNALCKFDIAVNSSIKKGEAEENEVLYLSIVTWKNIAEACAKFLKKGSRVRVRGSLKKTLWVGKDGVKREKHTVVAEKVLFVRNRIKKAA